MNKLEKLFYESEHSSDKWNTYFDIYDRHLDKFYQKDIHFVEVGVQKGGSLDMWSKYFGFNSTITGIDVDVECTKLKYNKTNISVEIGDQGSATFWDNFLRGHQIDVFVDDGGHFMDQQILTFEKVFPKLKVGGVYICEDCHTSYMPYNGGGLHVKSSFIEYAKGYIDTLHSFWHKELDTTQEHKNAIGKDLTGVVFYDSVVVFEKFGKRSMERVSSRN